MGTELMLQPVEQDEMFAVTGGSILNHMIDIAMTVVNHNVTTGNITTTGNNSPVTIINMGCGK